MTPADEAVVARHANRLAELKVVTPHDFLWKVGRSAYSDTRATKHRIDLLYEIARAYAVAAYGWAMLLGDAEASAKMDRLEQCADGSAKAAINTARVYLSIVADGYRRDQEIQAQAESGLADIVDMLSSAAEMLPSNDPEDSDSD